MRLRSRTAIASSLAAVAGAAAGAVTAARRTRPASATAPAAPPLDEVREDVWIETLLSRPVPAQPDPRGPVTMALYERLTEDDHAALRERLEPALQPMWDQAEEAMHPRLTLALSLWYGLPGAIERTGLTAPMPPDDIHAMARGPLASGGDPYIADLVISALRRAEMEPPDGATVLDFGCSSGRVLRTIAAYRPDLECLGCDPNGPAIRWAQENLPMATFFESPTSPPLDLGDGSVDTVYAISIWSHFAEDAALRWLEEMRRIIRPGGALLITTHGFDTMAEFLRRDAMTRESAARIARGLVAGEHVYLDVFGEEGDWGVKDPEWGNGYFTLDWLAARVTPEWSIRRFEPGALDGVQDIVVLERRPT